MTEKQRHRIEKMGESFRRLEVTAIPADSAFAVAYNSKGDVVWFEVVDPEATMLHAWDTGAPRI